MADLKEELKNLLLNCYNLILTGAPGTGKTHLAREIANAITGDDDNTPADKRHSCFVQFHPSYDYADFVEGLRPTKPDEKGNIGFDRRDGIFKEFCKLAIEKTNNAKPSAKQQSLDKAQVGENNNFEEAYSAFIKDLGEKHSADNPLEVKTPYGTPFNVFRNTKNGVSYLAKDSTVEPKRANSINIEGLKSYWSGKPSRKYHEIYHKGIIKYMEEHYNISSFSDLSDQNTVNTVQTMESMSNDQKYVFIIDEINRGDIAKIFGELFFALDPGYRGKHGSIKTPYDELIDDKDIFKGGFYVPENVFIIGTMNDIDRNVESMDFAIRRRFTWRKIKPEDTQKDILAGLKLGEEVIDEAQKRMDNLNKAIRKEQHLGENYCIGAAYFSKIDDSEQKWENLWKYHLEPLLNEYVRGLLDADALMKIFKIEYNKNTQVDEGTNVQ